MNILIVILRRLLAGALGLPFGGNPLAGLLIRRVRARRYAAQAFYASQAAPMGAPDPTSPSSPAYQQMSPPLGPPLGPPILWRRRHHRRYFS